MSFFFRTLIQTAVSFVRKLTKRSKTVLDIWNRFCALAALLKQKEEPYPQTESKNQAKPQTYTKLCACYMWL